MVRGIYIEMFLAEEEGFEPSVRLYVHRSFNPAL